MRRCTRTAQRTGGRNRALPEVCGYEFLGELNHRGHVFGLALSARNPSPNTVTPCFLDPMECKRSHPCSPQEIKEARSNDQSRGRHLLALSLATAVSVAAQAADEIKSGKWEFTTQMQLPFWRTAGRLS